MDKNIEIGEYKKIKGSMYRVVGISKPVSDMTKEDVGSYHAIGFHIETEGLLEIYQKSTIDFRHYKDKCEDVLVVYKSNEDYQTYLGPYA